MAFNGQKLVTEWQLYRRAWLLGDNTAQHQGGQWVNRWVEAARASAYWAGHVDAFAYPLLILAAVIGWVI